MRSGRSRSPHPIRRRARLGRGRSPLAPPVRRDRTPDLLSRPMPRNPPATLGAAHLSQRRKPQPAERRRAATPPSALPARRWLALRSATSGPLSRPVRTIAFATGTTPERTSPMATEQLRDDEVALPKLSDSGRPRGAVGSFGMAALVSEQERGRGPSSRSTPRPKSGRVCAALGIRTPSQVGVSGPGSDA